MNTGTAIKLAKSQARLWDARRGIREVLDTIEAMTLEGQLEANAELHSALKEARVQAEKALAEIMAQLEEAEE